MGVPVKPEKGLPMSKYHEYWIQNGQPSYSDVAAHFGVNESTARRSIQTKEKRLNSVDNAEQAVLDGMEALGFDGHPDGGWIKSQTPDKHGRTYSFRFTRDNREEEEDKMQKIADLFTQTPPTLFTPPEPQNNERVKKAFVSINDLHSGALAWGLETGYGDWDLDIAMNRLTDWLCRLFDHIQKEGVDEIILYYNGDTLHANGKVPMTATHGSDHILDVDSRHFKVVDVTGEQIIHTTDIAAQIADVRLVIKRGNHDGDSYLSLLQGAKWRYHNQENVTVEMNPNAYWAHIVGTFVQKFHQIVLFIFIRRVIKQVLHLVWIAR